MDGPNKPKPGTKIPSAISRAKKSALGPTRRGGVDFSSNGEGRSGEGMRQVTRKCPDWTGLELELDWNWVGFVHAFALSYSYDTTHHTARRLSSVRT